MLTISRFKFSECTKSFEFSECVGIFIRIKFKVCLLELKYLNQVCNFEINNLCYNFFNLYFYSS